MPAASGDATADRPPVALPMSSRGPHPRLLTAPPVSASGTRIGGIAMPGFSRTFYEGFGDSRALAWPLSGSGGALSQCAAQPSWARALDEVRAADSWVRRWLLHKAVSEEPQRARGSARQSRCARRPREGWSARDGRDGGFRSPPLEAIQWARRGFMQQPRRGAGVSGCAPAARPERGLGWRQPRSSHHGYGALWIGRGRRTAPLSRSREAVAQTVKMRSGVWPGA
jgi:hypothetical protein